MIRKSDFFILLEVLGDNCSQVLVTNTNGMFRDC